MTVLSLPGTVIIGAGAAGLATAAQLRSHDLPFRLLDAGHEVGESWRRRYDSLSLHTVRSLSGLPGLAIPKEYGAWVRRDDLVAYLQAYAAEFELFPEFGVEATRIERTASGWRVTTTTKEHDADEIDAAAVVVASGYSHTPWTPDWPHRDLFGGTMLHTRDYREPSPFRGRRVLVVGSGNSAADLVVDLAGVADEVLLAVRTPPTIVRRASFGVPSQLIGLATAKLPALAVNPLLGLLRKLTVPDLTGQGLAAPGGKSYSQFLRSRTVPILDTGFVDIVRSGGVRIVPAMASYTDTGARLADGSTVAVDTIIAATGYRPALEPLVGHLEVLDERGRPRAAGGRALPHAPGLHFVGITVELTGLLRQIGIESRRVARTIADSGKHARRIST